MLASSMTEDEILGDYPYLEKADFPAIYAYASQTGRERQSPPGAIRTEHMYDMSTSRS
jgi:uncharacterized protein (DUF433 family)